MQSSGKAVIFCDSAFNTIGELPGEGIFLTKQTTNIILNFFLNEMS